jgi:hypothetical protein
MLALFSVSISFGQDLKQHRWVQRVLIVTAKDTHLLKEQMDSLSKDIKGLQERKLAIYQVTPNGYAKGTRITNWTKTKDFYQRITKRKKDFEVILIGLDGGVKLRQTELLTLEKLFTLIDGMPMRRAEIRN